MEPVPGCNGSGRSGSDYCIDPAKMPPPTSRPTIYTGYGLGDPNYRLKIRLYWEEVGSNDFFVIVECNHRLSESTILFILTNTIHFVLKGIHMARNYKRSLVVHGMCRMRRLFDR